MTLDSRIPFEKANQQVLTSQGGRNWLNGPVWQATFRRTSLPAESIPSPGRPPGRLLGDFHEHNRPLERPAPFFPWSGFIDGERIPAFLIPFPVK